MKNEHQVVHDEIFGWTKRNALPSEPHQELMPWVAWFRPISARNHVWLMTWPHEEYLHP